METMGKSKKTAIIFLIIAMLAFVAAFAASRPKAAGAAGSWNLNGFTYDEETQVYSSGAYGEATMTYAGSDLSMYDTIEADIKYQPGTDGGSMAVIKIYASEDTVLWFAVAPNSPTDGPVVALVYKNDFGNNLKRVDLSDGAYGDCGAGADIHMKVKIRNNEIKYELNGIEVYSSSDTFGEAWWYKACVYSLSIETEVSNVQLSGTQEPGSEWLIPSSGWDETEENGETVYTRNATVGTTVVSANPVSGANSLELDLRVNETLFTEAPTRIIYAVESDSYTYVYDQAASSLRILKNDAELAAVSLSLALGEWARLRVVFAPEFLGVYKVGESEDKLLVSAFETGRTYMEGGRIKLEGSNVKFSVKNMEIKQSEISGELVGYLDLKFKDAKSVAGFKAENGTKSFGDNSLVFTFGGANPRITSPVVNAPRGEEYSALLSVRNTIIARIKNDSAASAVRVYFVTSEDEQYDEEKSLLFPITENSGFATYYFNLSQNSLASGYLRGFAFEFIGAETGSAEISGVRFEREEPYYEYAGAIEECTATEDTVTVKGIVNPAYNGKKVTVYRSEVENQYENLNFEGGLLPLGTAAVSNGKFTVTFPNKQGNMTHLSSLFLAEVGGVKVSKHFQIENWQDFIENPYAFQLPDYSVKVTDYGAAGDAFTNDTAAIQAAIDAVSANGGGKVIVPGSAEPYGRRYVMTGIKLKDNVELVIENGAVLWQSADIDDYTDYEIYPGHHNMGPPYIAWGSSALMHLPFVFINGVENVKISGGGTLRMADTGTESTDSDGICVDKVYGEGADPFQIGCDNIVHLVPVGIYGSSNVEVTNLSVRRSNFWHFYVREVSNLYLGNIDLAEVNCINGDGFDFSTAVHDVVMARCSVYTNDDALGICVTVNDPRDDVSTWRNKSTKEDKSMYNFLIKYCNLSGGHGMTFMPWASEAPDQSKVEIKDIEVYDTVFNGNWSSIGGWWDNPFYGESNYYLGTYDNGDSEIDHSPVKNITIIDVRCKNSFDISKGNFTNLVTNLALTGSSAFENGNFDKIVKYENETDYVTGTSYWSSEGETGTEQIQSDYGYSGYVRGSGAMFEGLWLAAGNYKFALETRFSAGSAALFARNSLTGEIIAEKALNASDAFAQAYLEFALQDGGAVQLGVRYTGESGETLYIDNAAVTEILPVIPDEPDDKTEINFDEEGDLNNFELISGGENAAVSDGKLNISADADYMLVFDGENAREFEFTVEMVPSADGKFSAGALVLVDAMAENGMFNGYNVQAFKDAGSGVYHIYISRFTAENGNTGVVAQSKSLAYNGEKIILRIVLNGGVLNVFADNGSTSAVSCSVADVGRGGKFGLRSLYSDTGFEKIQIKIVEQELDFAQLEETVAMVEKIIVENYSEASVEALNAALAVAENLPSNALQEDVDAATLAIKQAAAGLVKIQPEPVDGETDGGSSFKAERIALWTVAGVCFAAAIVMLVLTLRKRKV